MVKFVVPDLQMSPISFLPSRWLNLQEYQSKKLMEDNGIAVQKFKLAENAQQAADISKNFRRFIQKTSSEAPMT